MLSKEAQFLKKKDKILGKIILEDLPVLKSRGNVYESLLSSIISQQISLGAARSIKEKFLKLFNKNTLKFPRIKELLEISDEDLRSAGLSKPKIGYMKNVAEHYKTPPSLPLLRGGTVQYENMSDSEVIADLVKIKGVGEWTAEMILIFSLLKPDVYSYKDLALTNTIIETYNIKKDNYTPKQLKEEVLKITDKWSPHRSLASRYLWEYRGKKKIKLINKNLT